jgi:hypothetical protein
MLQDFFVRFLKVCLSLGFFMRFTCYLNVVIIFALIVTNQSAGKNYFLTTFIFVQTYAFFL